MRKIITTEALFRALDTANLEHLVETAAAFGPGAFTALNDGGKTLHAVALGKFMVSVIVEGDDIHERRDSLRWLIEQRAPFPDQTPESGLAFAFCQANWAGTANADIACEMMAEYIDKHYLDPNSLVRCDNGSADALGRYSVLPALAATFYCANPAAARVLLDGGADEAVALNGSGHSDLAEYANSFRHWSSGMVAATVTEFQMQRQIDKMRIVHDSASTEAPSRPKPGV